MFKALNIKRIRRKIKTSIRKISFLIFKNKYHYYYKLLYDKNGIEIGGPSAFFSQIIDIYSIIKSLDGVNFSSSTIWEGKLNEGLSYKFGNNKIGYQYICDAVNMECIESSKYDFVLSCNNLEHIANPFKAISEMLRIIKKDGLIFLVLPNKNTNFDHKREITSFNHLQDDYEKNVTEEDISHLEEILALHDLSMDPLAGDFGNFKNRSLKNYQNRCLHHHVFNMAILIKIFKYFNIKLLVKDYTYTDYIIVGKKNVKTSKRCLRIETDIDNMGKN